MKLKFKPINFESGRPVAFINEVFAEKFNIYEGTRIEVAFKTKKLTLVVNTVEKFLKKNEISFSDEAIAYLKIKKNDEVNISPASRPQSIDFIFKKINKKGLTKKEIYAIIQDIVDNVLSEAEIAYFISAVFHNGMSLKETTHLTEAMAKTGKILTWKKKKVADKHSIGGVPGNRTTPIIVSICAASGITMPKTSSRAITSAAGTADVIETITNVGLSETKLKNVVKKTNACLAWGGSLGLAPADDKLIRVERLLNIDPEPQLIASILAKKISMGSKYVLIDIPYGKGAKVSVTKALQLRKKFSKIGKHFGLKMNIVLTFGLEPIGNGIGPILEMIDILKILKRDDPPRDLEEKSIFLAAQLLETMGEAKKGQGEKLARKILNSGKALKKFEEITFAQGKKNIKLQPAKFNHVIKAHQTTRIKSIDNKPINLLAKILGCPTSAASGLYLHKHRDDNVKKGEPILTLYSHSRKKLQEGIKFYHKTRPIHL